MFEILLIGIIQQTKNYFLFFKKDFYFSQPALKIIARLRKMARHVHVALFNDASALLALVNIELPLAAIPPMPSPLGLCKSTNKMRIIPVETHIQERRGISIIY